MTKKNYLKLILTTTLLFFAAIFAAAKINATAPDVNFGNATALTWKEFSGEEDFFDLGTDEIDVWTSITGIADFTNSTDTPEFVAYNSVNAIYTGHTESYIYWVFDGVLEEVHFYNYKFHKSETVAYADLVDVRSVDIEIPIVQHTVSFYNEDVLHANKVVMTNEVVELPEDPLKDGHHFVGWYYDENFHYEYDVENLADHDFNLYAKFQADDININFYVNNFYFNNVEVKYGNNLISYSVPKYIESYYKTDFTKNTEYFDKSNNIISSANSSLISNKIMSDVIGFKWDFRFSRDYGSVTFKIGNRSFFYASGDNGRSQSGFFFLNEPLTGIIELSGSNISTASITINELEFYKSKSQIFDNDFEFENWYYDEELTQPYNKNDVFLEDTNLYAGYQEVENNIEFKVDNEVYHFFISNNFNIELPEDPVKVGYTFDGWYYEEEFLNAFNIETDITDDLTLYAKFTLNEHTITFNYNNEVYATAIYDIENGVVLPEIPEVALEDEFLGWYYDELFENRFNTTDVITEDITLYGKIETINFNIDFKVDNEVYDSILYIKDSELILPATPEKEDHVFLGWYYDKNFENKFNIEDQIAEDIILYGNFSSDSGGGSAIDDPDEAGFKTEYVVYAVLGVVGLVVIVGLIKGTTKKSKRK